MRPVLAFFLVMLGLTAGATALAIKYDPRTASYVAAGGMALGLGVLLAMGSEVKQAARQLWGR